MNLCGSYTRSRFDRYNIVGEADLAAAAAERFGNGKQAQTLSLPRKPKIP